MTDINPLDIVIPILLLLYFLAGIRSGFFTTLGTFLGLGLGVCAAAWLVPLAVASVGSQWSLITAVGVLILCLTIGQWLGIVAGRTIRRVTDITLRSRTGRVDHLDAHRTHPTAERRTQPVQSPDLDGHQHPRGPQGPN